MVPDTDLANYEIAPFLVLVPVLIKQWDYSGTASNSLFLQQMSSAEWLLVRRLNQPQMSSLDQNAVILDGLRRRQESPWALGTVGCPNVAEQEGFRGVQLTAMLKSAIVFCEGGWGMKFFSEIPLPLSSKSVLFCCCSCIFSHFFSLAMSSFIGNVQYRYF